MLMVLRVVSMEFWASLCERFLPHRSGGPPAGRRAGHPARRPQGPMASTRTNWKSAWLLPGGETPPSTAGGTPTATAKVAGAARCAIPASR